MYENHWKLHKFLEIFHVLEVWSPSIICSLKLLYKMHLCMTGSHMNVQLFLNKKETVTVLITVIFRIKHFRRKVYFFSLSTGAGMRECVFLFISEYVYLFLYIYFHLSVYLSLCVFISVCKSYLCLCLSCLSPCLYIRLCLTLWMKLNVSHYPPPSY